MELSLPEEAGEEAAALSLVLVAACELAAASVLLALLVAALASVVVLAALESAVLLAVLVAATVLLVAALELLVAAVLAHPPASATVNKPVAMSAVILFLYIKTHPFQPNRTNFLGVATPYAPFLKLP